MVGKRAASVFNRIVTVHFSKGQSGNPNDRPKGRKNKRTLEVEAVAAKIVDDPVVQALWLKQAQAGELPVPILQTLVYYRWGRPVERIEHSGEIEHAMQIVEVTLG